MELSVFKDEFNVSTLDKMPASSWPSSVHVLETGQVLDLESVGPAVRLVPRERRLAVLASDDRAVLVEEEQLACGDRDRFHVLVADDDGLVHGGCGLVDDVARMRDPVVLEVAPGAANVVNDHGAGVVVGRQVGADRHPESGNDLTAHWVDLEVFEHHL